MAALFVLSWAAARPAKAEQTYLIFPKHQHRLLFLRNFSWRETAAAMPPVTCLRTA
jgi:hypothetical protein